MPQNPIKTPSEISRINFFICNTFLLHIRYLHRKKLIRNVLNSTFLSKFAENRIAYAGLSVGLYNILCWQPCRPTKDECKQSVQDVALVGYIGWIYSAML